MKSCFRFFVLLAYVLVVPEQLNTQWVYTNRPGTFYALATLGANVYAGQDSWILRSTDRGVSWDINLFGGCGDFAVQNNTIFAAHRGVKRSTNNGITWDSVNVGLPNLSIYCLATRDTYVFAGRRNGGVSVSTNAGGSWNSVDIVPSPFAVEALATNSTYVFAAIYAVGMYRSTNNGTTWGEANVGLGDAYITSIVSNSAYVFAASDLRGVFRTSDNGTTWVGMSNGLRYRVWDLVVVGGSIFAATDRGVYVSSNSGASWVTVNEGLAVLDVRSLAANDSFLFAGNYNGGLWRRSLSDFTTSVELPETNGPHNFGLFQNYPNPFNPSTTISFSLPTTLIVSLKIFDALGREVAVLLSEELSPGTYTQQWSAAALASGVYFYRLQAGSFVETKKLLLLR